MFWFAIVCALICVIAGSLENTGYDDKDDSNSDVNFLKNSNNKHWNRSSDYKIPKIFTSSSDFKIFRLENEIIVDKSFLIAEILKPDLGKTILITRPRRWGKSLNLSMLRRFFEIEVNATGHILPESERVNRKLFYGGCVDVGVLGTKILPPLKISRLPQVKAFQGQYPVIWLDLSTVDGFNYREFTDSFKLQVAQTFRHHNYVFYNRRTGDGVDRKRFEKYANGQFSNDEDLSVSIYFLAETLFKYHFQQKVIILVDDYDLVLMRAHVAFGSNSDEFEDAVLLFEQLYVSTFSRLDYVERAILTGVLSAPTFHWIFQHGYDGIEQHTLLSKKFAMCYGFSEVEVEMLLNAIPIKVSFVKLREWYDGYDYGAGVLYNPSSIIEFFKSGGILNYYWISNSLPGVCDFLMQTKKIRVLLKKLASGNVVSTKHPLRLLKHQENDISQKKVAFQLLLFSGLINVEHHDSELKNKHFYSLPNNEVKFIFTQEWKAV